MLPKKQSLTVSLSTTGGATLALDNGTVDFFTDGMNVSVSATASDYLRVTGTASGTHQVIIKRTEADMAAFVPRMELPMIYVGADGGVSFSGQTDVGMRVAILQLGDLSGGNLDQWFLVLGNSSAGGGGHAALATELSHELAWYADAVARVERFDSSFDAYDSSRNRTSGDYGNWATGASLEFGRQFKFAGDWFAEPQLQLSYAHFFGSNYTTGGENIFDIAISDKDLLQLRAGALLGRTLKLNNSNAILQPYLKAFAIEQVSTGGRLVTADGQWRPNLDGPSAVIGTGIIWQLDDNNQFNLDYEAQFAKDYDKPWSINLGFRHKF